MLALGLLNTLLSAMHDRERRMRAIVAGWLLGRRAQPLAGLPWRRHFSTPIAVLRRDYGLDLAFVDGVVSETWLSFAE